ncbi:RNA polymerase sigma factor [Streptomyces sp. RK75]|uniref:RNA polymerase sigma factor n=1 Tax=Streptomyces sp. RK75 TaxID=2824895 RepID=UPI001B39A319|nr:RNA polymerase sigma factor [Streptomyces sp. RK75]MBQ0867404.1 RNA polymerase sigma factor [Streptomyces sp. RK75]
MNRIPSEYRAEIASLYRERHRELWSFASRLLHEERDLAQDMIQEVFQAAAFRWGHLRWLDRGRQRAWLFRVLKNKIFDHWGAAKRQESLPDVWETAAACDTPRVAVSNLLLLRCWSVINSMSRAQRRVALLRWHAEWTTGEIADHLRLSRKTVHAHLSNARHVLLKELGDEVVFPSDWLLMDSEEEVSR